MAKRELCSVTVLSFLCVCNFSVVFVSALATGQAPENVLTSCAAVKPIFEMKNISVDILDTPVNGLSLNVCSAERSCCSAQMEQALLRLVRSDFEALLHHNSRSLQGLLVSAADTVRDHVWELLRQSESRTLSLVSVVVPRSLPAARAAVARLYARLRSQVERPLLPAGAPPQDAEGQAEAEVEAAVGGAFWALFPLLYRQALPARRGQAHGQGQGQGQRALAPDYEACLRAAAPELQPFGSAPARLAAALTEALAAARLLRQALLAGAAVLADADTLLTSTPGDGEPWRECERALLRMSYCSRCGGQATARPCAGLCLNVARGCLTQHAAELDLPWNGYVEAAERLAGAARTHAAAEEALRDVDAHVAEAVIIAMEARPALDRKVKLSCGPYRWASEPEAAEVGSGGGSGGAEAAAGGGGAAQSQHGPATETLSSKLQPFVASLSRSRGFYANLAESLCSDESFAETRDTADCWNGQRIGEYTKTVVASSISAQKYNPEITWTPHKPDMRIAELSDQLRHIKQVVVSHVSEAPSALALTRYEGGSGSGQQPGDPDSWDDDADSADAWPDQGSGSGDAPVLPEGGDRGATENVQVSPGAGADKPRADSGAGPASPAVSASLLAVACGAVLSALCHRAA